MRSKVAAIVKRYNVDDARAEAIADEIMTLDASDELKDKVERWKFLNRLKHAADDGTIRPVCFDLVYFCHCNEQLSDEILQELMM